MRAFIIVTVKIKQEDTSYDIEVPTNVEVQKLKQDIAETLNAYNKELSLIPAQLEIYSNRLSRVLRLNETFADANLMNGDSLVIIDCFDEALS